MSLAVLLLTSAASLLNFKMGFEWWVTCTSKYMRCSRKTTVLHDQQEQLLEIELGGNANAQRKQMSELHVYWNG